MKKKDNKGVRCDVSSCIFNKKGCDCALEEIRVTSGETNHLHFCGSFRPDESVEVDEDLGHLDDRYDM